MRFVALLSTVALLVPLATTGCSSSSSRLAWNRPEMQGWKFSKDKEKGTESALASKSPTLPSTAATPSTLASTAPPYSTYPGGAGGAYASAPTVGVYPGQPASYTGATGYPATPPYGATAPYDPNAIGSYPVTGPQAGAGQGAYNPSYPAAGGYAQQPSQAAPYDPNAYPAYPTSGATSSMAPEYTADARSGYGAAPSYGQPQANGSEGYPTGSPYDANPQQGMPAGQYPADAGRYGPNGNGAAAPSTGYGEPYSSSAPEGQGYGSAAPYADPTAAAQPSRYDAGNYPTTSAPDYSNAPVDPYASSGGRYGDGAANATSAGRYEYPATSTASPQAPTGSAESSAPTPHYRPGGTSDYIQPGAAQSNPMSSGQPTEVKPSQATPAGYNSPVSPSSYLPRETDPVTMGRAGV